MLTSTKTCENGEQTEANSSVAACTGVQHITGVDIENKRDIQVMAHAVSHVETPAVEIWRQRLLAFQLRKVQIRHLQ